MRMHSEIIDDLILAEASAWLARLQGPSRSAAAEAAFQSWLSADVRHAQAFGRVTDTWEIIPGAALLRAATPAATTGGSRPRMLLAVAASMALVALGAGIGWYKLHNPTYHTAIGELQTVALEDGTRITLNTDSKLVVSYSEAERHVRLDHGEALFEVAKQAQRPFIVQVGDQQVRALGTTFVIRRDANSDAIALIEGRVEVSPEHRVHDGTDSGKTVLSPGERVTLRRNAARTLDRPNVAEMTAWRSGEAMFDDVTLAQAIAEINRYGESHVQLDDPALAQLRISGVFSTRDPAEFAGTIAKLHGLNVERVGENLVIRR
jgi:transmembrane sensor